MKITMIGLDHTSADLKTREAFSFTSNEAESLLIALKYDHHLDGCVLLSTCNRTELYLSGAVNRDPATLLGDHPELFTVKCGQDAALHLMQVACGVKSQIWGEDQIVSQVKRAICVARDAHTADSLLETLFRTAVTAAKRIKTEVRLTAVPDSVAYRAVKLVERKLGILKGKRVLVIGNGEMGRLTARLMRECGCSVTMTIRTYRHGETIIPDGCNSIGYDDRMDAVSQSDCVISATTSPHYTICTEQLKQLKQQPQLLIDLAVPRDIDPTVQACCSIPCYNVDSLGGTVIQKANQQQLEQVNKILKEQYQQFEEWLNIRNCLPMIAQIKRASYHRVINTPAMSEAVTNLTDENIDSVIQSAVDRSVELVLYGIKERIDPQILGECAEKIMSKERNIMFKKD